MTVGLLTAILEHPSSPEHAALAAALKLDERSNVLLISTEGDTDPESYLSIVNSA